RPDRAARGADPRPGEEGVLGPPHQVPADAAADGASQRPHRGHPLDRARLGRHPVEPRRAQPAQAGDRSSGLRDRDRPLRLPRGRPDAPAEHRRERPRGRRRLRPSGADAKAPRSPTAPPPLPRVLPGGGMRGSTRVSHSPPATQTAPGAAPATVTGANTVIPVMISGAASLPAPSIVFHQARYRVRPCTGETSTLSVITIPEPRPLPSPISSVGTISATSAAVVPRSARTVPSTPSSRNPSPISSAQGTATAARPYRSM